MSDFETEMTTQKCVVIFISSPAFSGTHSHRCRDGRNGSTRKLLLGSHDLGKLQVVRAGGETHRPCFFAPNHSRRAGYK